MPGDKEHMYADTETLLRRLAAQEHALRMSDEQTARLLSAMQSGYHRHKRIRMYRKVLKSAAALVLLAGAGAAYTLHQDDVTPLAGAGSTEGIPVWRPPAPESTPDMYDTVLNAPAAIQSTPQMATVVPESKLSGKKSARRKTTVEISPDYARMAQLLSRDKTDADELRRTLPVGISVLIPTGDGCITITHRSDVTLEITTPDGSDLQLKAHGDTLPAELRQLLQTTP